MLTVGSRFVNVSASPDQESHHIGVPLCGGTDQGGSPSIVCFAIYVCPEFEEPIHFRSFAIAGGVYHWLLYERIPALAHNRDEKKCSRYRGTANTAELWLLVLSVRFCLAQSASPFSCLT